MTTDTGSPNGTDISDAHRAFAAAFVATGNSAQAAAAAGVSPRVAARILARDDVQDEIARLRAALAEREAVPAEDVSLDALIANARAAYKVAADSNNANAMVAATTLLARLVDKMDGEAVELKDKQTGPITPEQHRDNARAVCSWLLDSHPDAAEAFHFALAVRAGDRPVAVGEVGEVLIAVPAALADTIGGEVAQSLAEAASEARKYEPGDKEFFDGGWIEYCKLSDGNHPVLKWGIFTHRGVLLGYRRSRADAIALVQALPAQPAPQTNITENDTDGA